MCTGNERYKTAPFSANRFVRTTVNVDGTEEVRSGIKGSFPVGGAYRRFGFLNWACKFFLDANLMERDVLRREKETESTNQEQKC